MTYSDWCFVLGGMAALGWTLFLRYYNDARFWKNLCTEALDVLDRQSMLTDECIRLLLLYGVCRVSSSTEPKEEPEEPTSPGISEALKFYRGCQKGYQ